ncbi:9708_t:CDS:2 [Entrophospora sp. SA101]|nr:9708_t:CDS:2 [Entrophospora sp. SA101]
MNSTSYDERYQRKEIYIAIPKLVDSNETVSEEDSNDSEYEEATFEKSKKNLNCYLLIWYNGSYIMFPTKGFHQGFYGPRNVQYTIR